jgi:anti-sigma-K factor RskA
MASAGNRPWRWLVLAAVAVVILVIAVPTLMSVVKTSARNPAVADRQTTQRTDAKSQHQRQPAGP